MFRTSPKALGLALVAGLAFVACGGDDNNNNNNNNNNNTDSVKVEAFAASPTTVASGGTTTLTWTVSGSAGLSVQITATPGGELTTSTMLTGSVTSQPINANTTFKLTVTKGTASATREVTVNVDTTAVGITSFTASPQMPARGGQVTLGWATTNATSVAIFEGATQVFQSTTMVASGTTQVPVPNATHTFRLVATKSATEMAERTLTVNTTAPVGETEPNNDAATAQVLTGGAASGSINPSGDLDYYKITIPAGGNIRAETFAGTSTITCSPDTKLALIAPDGTTEIASDDDGGPGLCSLLNPATNSDLVNLAAGDYFVVVSAIGTATGAYSLQVAVGTAGCGNGFQETGEQCDDGNTAEGDGCTATCQISYAGTVMGPVPQMGMFTGGIMPANNTDNYQVILPTEGYIWARIGVPTIGLCEPTGANDTVLTLLDSTGAVITSDDDSGWPCSFLDPSADQDLRVPAGTYTIRVESYNNNQVIPSYQIQIRTIAPDACGNDVFEEGEQCDDGNTAAGDGCSATCTFEIAGTITPPGGDVVVTVAPYDAANPPLPRFIAVTITEGQSLTATTSNGAGACPFGTVIGLFNADFTEQLGVVNGQGGCANFDARENDFAANLAAGTYHIGVISSEATGGALTVTVNVINPGCGNGITDVVGLPTAEQCDDNNTTAGDGCSATCTVEVAGTVNPPSGNVNVTLDARGGRSQFIAINIATAGQSIRVVTTNNNGNVCTVQPDLALRAPDFATTLGFNLADDTTTDCTGIDPAADPWAAGLAVGTYYLEVAPWVGQGALRVQVTIVNPACGNGITEAASGEQCDDSNTTAGDGCSATCTVEATAINATIGGPVVTVSGALGMSEVDTYSVTIPAGMTATLEATTYTTQGMPAMGCTGQEDTTLTVRASDFSQLAFNDDVMFPNNTCSSVTGNPAVAGLTAGTYYIQVRPYDTSTLANYYLDVRLVP